MGRLETVREDLGKLRSGANEKARLDRLRKLPKPLAKLGFEWLGKSLDDESGDYESVHNSQQKAWLGLLAKPADRRKIEAALFPTLPDAFEAAIVMQGRLPYTLGYGRRPFRATEMDERHASMRAGFLADVFGALAEYPDDVLNAEWIAIHAGHTYDQSELGQLIAGALDLGGPESDKVFETLKEIVGGQHPVGVFGSYASRALLACNRPEAWEFMEKTLLAAQRNEGLRQAIFEAVDESHPEAFARMLRIFLDKDLTRFSSVARAGAVWLGVPESALAPAKLKKDLERIHEMLNDETARAKAIAKGDAPDLYTALWCTAFFDADEALRLATPLAKDKSAARRQAVAKLVGQLQNPAAYPLIFDMLADPEPMVAWQAHAEMAGLGDGGHSVFAFDKAPQDAFEKIEVWLAKLPDKPTELKPLVPEWGGAEIGKESAAKLLLQFIGDRPADRLLPHVHWLNDYGRKEVMDRAAKEPKLSPAMRQFIVSSVGDRASYPRQAALKILEDLKLSKEEVPVFEGYLSRKGDIRLPIFGLLMKRDDKAVLETLDRLLDAKDANQRLAGIEIGRQMVQTGRAADEVKAKLSAFRDDRKRPKPEQEAVEGALAIRPDAEKLTLENGLGLFDPKDMTQPVEAKPKKIDLQTPAAAAFIKSLDDFIHEHRETSFSITGPNGGVTEKVLGALQYSWDFPGVYRHDGKDVSKESLPLAGLWEQWWKQRPATTRDKDGFELLRAYAFPMHSSREGEVDDDEVPVGSVDQRVELAVKAILSNERRYYDNDEAWTPLSKDAEKQLRATIKETISVLHPLPPVHVRYKPLISDLLGWMLFLHPVKGGTDFLLDAIEMGDHQQFKLFDVPCEGRIATNISESVRSGRTDPWWNAMDWLRGWFPKEWTKERAARAFQICVRRDRPRRGVERSRPGFNELLLGYEAGAANECDFLDQLIGPRARSRYSNEGFDELRNSTAGPNKKLDTHPVLLAARDRVVERILEIELARGEEPTAASAPALQIQRLFGMETLFRVLKVLGKTPLAKVSDYSWRAKEGKVNVLSKFLMITRPLPTDTPEDFAKQVKVHIAAGDFTEERVRELALLNPHWVAHVEKAIGWPGTREAVWWLIAHSSNRWDVTAHQHMDEEEKKNAEEWQKIVKGRTHLTAEQRAEGMVDVAWFHQAYKAVGNAKRWDAIEAASKFLSDGQGNKKALRLADVLLGVTKKKELVTGIQQRNLKEFVALLGLLPLPADPAKKDAEIADRYKTLKTYERYAKGLSSLSKEPALQAARLGLSNLATTAELGDPMRLEWAVSGKAVAGLLDGPVEVKVKDVTVRLALNHLAEPEIDQTKAGKPLKSVPPDVKKNPKVAELFDWRKDLQRMSSSTLKSLEQAMCAGEPFTAAEIQSLMGHALVKPLLERLVLKGDGILGYPVKGGKGLRDHKGKVEPVKAKETLTLAHPLDLLEAGDWADWQKECFAVERLQPFKQVFREVYVPTKEERKAPESRRYAGQQVNPTQALALFGNRGWSVKDGVDKRFRTAGIVAEVYFNSGVTTPAEMECPTLEYVRFHKIGSWDAVPLKDVPAVVFSEVMRDLDLVVSVAHAGGVDPEASASTVEMRSALLKETFGLLGIKNVKLEKSHATIAGELGKYSVHLGSGVVHKLPGGSLCIVPVHSQHRGRLFLPFADNDPKTAEVVSKILLLARDKEIQDPTILDQIAAR